MKTYSLDSLLQQVYARFPEAQHRPVVAITTNYIDGDAALREVYYKQVVKAGGVPLLMPPVADSDVIINTLEHVDALLLTGGADYNPLWAGEEPSPRLHGINAERDEAELLTCRLAYDRMMPILGICRGCQTIAMALDGHVAQDISARPDGIRHSQDAGRTEPTHSIKIEPGSVLASLYGEKIYVNSFHHQAVDNAGERFHATAWATDGIIESIESSEHRAIVGVQWHPECLEEDGLRLFSWLVSEAGLYAKAVDIHRSTITLDSHCDTPMFFPQGIDFSQRDDRILVDLHKMALGHQDVATMVAYLPQPKPGEEFADIAPLPVEGPREYADLIFDKIETIVSQHDDVMAMARTEADICANKAEHRRSIMIGIENGLALDGQIQNIEHFAQRGIVYITLCHNGDNDICDSARGSATWGGLSPFGREVVSEMNRLGVMIDLSHAAESTFYDAIEASLKPCVCSHSNCKSLCDVPRNLTDDQLRAIAQRGGVVQTTLYAGFLRREGEVSVVDAIDHLDHCVEIMGIDHVGLGTDFDGDGGVCGLAHSGELLNFTLHLLRRRYSEADIRQIWGGNWLRVLGENQRK